MRGWASKAIGAIAALILMAGCAGTNTAETAQSDQAASPSASASVTNTKASVSGTTFPMEITDFMGNSLTLEKRPEKIAVLSGTALNIFYDAGGKAAATTTLTDNVRLDSEYASELKTIPELGPPYAIDSEALVALNPDLVITFAGAQNSLSSQLADLGIPTFVSTIKNRDDLAMAYKIFGAIAGTSDHAQERIDQINKDTDEAISKWPADDHPSVAILYVTANSVSVKLDKSIAGNIALSLGLTNVASAMAPEAPGSENATLDVEALVAAQPDYIMVTSMVASNDEAKKRLDDQFASNQAWQAVDAVRNNKVIHLPQQYFLYNAGPYYADSVTYMASTIHPEIYGNLVEPA